MGCYHDRLRGAAGLTDVQLLVHVQRGDVVGTGLVGGGGLLYQAVNGFELIGYMRCVVLVVAERIGQLRDGVQNCRGAIDQGIYCIIAVGYGILIWNIAQANRRAGQPRDVATIKGHRIL